MLCAARWAQLLLTPRSPIAATRTAYDVIGAEAARLAALLLPVRVADVGCGLGQDTRLLREHGLRGGRPRPVGPGMLAVLGVPAQPAETGFCESQTCRLRIDSTPSPLR